MNLSPILFVLCVVMGVALCFSEGLTQGLVKVRIGYATPAAAELPLWVGEDAGLYRKYGLDVQLIYIRGGNTLMQAMVARQLEVALGGAAAAVTSALNKLPVVIIGSTSNKARMSLYSKKNISRPPDLVGKTVAVSTTGGEGLTYLKFCLADLGMSIADLKILNMISGSDRANALFAGVVDAAMITAPQDFDAKKKGYTMMCDLERLNIPAQAQVLSSKRDWIAMNRPTALNVLRAYLDAVSFVRTQKQESKQFLAKRLRINEPELLEHTYNYVVRSQEIKAYPTMEGIAKIIETLKDHRLVTAEQAQPEAVVDLSLLNELDSSGFIDSLYKGKAK